MKIKKLGYLFCHTPVFMTGCGEKVTTVGKFYTIISRTEYKYVIRDDAKHEHTFSTKGYEKWFSYSPKIMRGLKKHTERIFDTENFWV